MAATLKSPRFATSERLQKAANNKPAIFKGESGEAIRILQQALVDLGFPLPNSYKKFGSPDGVFGSETKDALKKMQSKHKLNPDGIAGANTMAKLDELLPKAGDPIPPLPPGGAYTHRLNLHLRSIAMPHVGELRQFAEMRRVYAQYGIDVVMASGMSLGLTGHETITLNEVNGNCEWDEVSDDQQLLQDLGRGGVKPNEVVAYFATVIKKKNGDTLQGCASHRPGKPACMIAASAVDITTLGHEVGHVLLTSAFAPVHDPDSDNLMCEAAVCTGNPANLNEAQLTKLKASPFLLKL